MLGWLRCPRCRSELQRLVDGLNCASCGGCYPVTEGIPTFPDQRPPAARLTDVMPAQRMREFGLDPPMLKKVRAAYRVNRYVRRPMFRALVSCSLRGARIVTSVRREIASLLE